MKLKTNVSTIKACLKFSIYFKHICDLELQGELQIQILDCGNEGQFCHSY